MNMGLTKIQNEAFKEYLEDSEDVVDPELLNSIKSTRKNIKLGVKNSKEELEEVENDIIL